MGNDKPVVAPLHRDMDFIRELLLTIERGERSFCILTSDMAEMLGIEDSICASANEVARLENHLELLEDAGSRNLSETQEATGMRNASRGTDMSF